MKAHPFDAVSLVFGVVFAGIGALFLTGNDVGDLVARFWPAAVVLLGLAMLFTAKRVDETNPPSPARPAPVVTPAPVVIPAPAPAASEAASPPGDDVAPPEKGPSPAGPAQ